MSPGNEEMRPEYDIRGGVRGTYFRASKGEHARQSRIRMGAEPIHRTLRLDVGEPAR